ncbi:MAG TPA: hypothetical protein VE398_17110 [Acidobacteriota bacterium]|nr:hypothetical protein [Acidobacteriota bacterium]
MSSNDLYVYRSSTNELFQVTCKPNTNQVLNDITVLPSAQIRVVRTQATTQAIDSRVSIALDGAGGSYVASPIQNRVYGVASDGRLSIAAGDGASGTLLRYRCNFLAVFRKSCDTKPIGIDAP